MKHILLLFLLFPVLLFAQYPNTGNKARLGYQTTGDGLIWRGVAADTVIKPRTTANAYFQLDTVNRVLRRYIATQGSWQVVAITPNLTPYALKTYVDSLYATDHDRDSTNELQTLTFASPLLGISDGNNVNLSDLLIGYVTGSGTNNRVPKWSALTNLTDSNIQDNGTAVSILNSKPFALGQWTTAGRPSGTQGYLGYNTTTNGLDWYNGTRWASGLESTFARGTATRVPFFDANGQVTESANMVADISNNRYYLAGSGNTGTSTLTSSTGLRLELRTTDNTGNSGGFLAFGSQFGTGAAIKYIHASGASLTSGGIGFYTREAVSDATLTRQITLDYTGSFTVEKNVILKGGVTMGRVGINNGVSGSGTYGNITEGILSTGVYQNSQAALKLEMLLGNYDFQTAPIGTVNTPVTLTSRMYLTNAGLLRLGGTGTTNYQLDVQGTNAIGIPRGTVAQRPTIASSTTPVRFNTDSTAIEYGESVGTWRQIATRAYARSLISGLGTGSVTSVGLSLPSIFSISGSPVTTSGTLSASFTGGAASQFLRGDGRWMKSLYFNSADSVTFNASGGALLRVDGEDGGFYSKWEAFDYGYIAQTLSISSIDDNRYIFNRSRGTSTSPTALVKNDRTGGIYFNAHNGSTYRKAGYIGAVVDSVYSGGLPITKIIFGVDETNFPEVSASWRFIVKDTRNISIRDALVGENFAVGLSGGVALETSTIDARLHLKGIGTSTSKTMLVEDSGGADILTITDNKTIQAHGYGTGTKEAADLSKTQSNYIAGFATDGTVLDLNVDTLLKKEKYFTITSTSSPQTLSNNFSDNLINQGGTQATFTLKFPASPVDGQVLKITYNNAITTLTLDGNGNTIVGSAVTTGVAGSQRAFKFYTGIGWIKLY